MESNEISRKLCRNGYFFQMYGIRHNIKENAFLYMKCYFGEFLTVYNCGERKRWKETTLQLAGH